VALFCVGQFLVSNIAKKIHTGFQKFVWEPPHQWPPMAANGRQWPPMAANGQKKGVNRWCLPTSM
jgi:phage-related protein